MRGLPGTVCIHTIADTPCTSATECREASMEFKAVPSAMGSFSATNKDAAATISGAGSADSTAMLGSAAAALGPIGANYLAAYAPAQANNLAATKLLAYLHAALGGATDGSVKAIVGNEDIPPPIADADRHCWERRDNA
jgi:hypothetical protein